MRWSKSVFGLVVAVAFGAAALLPLSVSTTDQGAVRLTSNEACAQSGCGCIESPNDWCWGCDAADEWGWDCNFGCSVE